MIDFGYDLEKALHAPRIDVSGLDQAGVDPRFGPEVMSAVDEVLATVPQERAVYPASFAIPSAIEVSAAAPRDFGGGAIGMCDPFSPLSGVARG